MRERHTVQRRIFEHYAEHEIEALVIGLYIRR